MDSGGSKNLEQQSTARAVLYALTSWIVIGITIALALRGPIWFTPIAVLIIANRQLALSFLAHEGLHGNLAPSSRFNDLFARYVCAFPVFISLSRYRLFHLMHHRFLGTKSDPDVRFYDFYPQKPTRLIVTFLGPWMAGATALLYINYFSDVFGFLRAQVMTLIAPRSLKWKAPEELRRGDDRWSFIIFWCAIVGAVLLTKTAWLFALYWVLPLYCYVLYFRFTGGLQHGTIFERAGARSIVGNGLVMEILLPCKINYHEEHHINPRVPFFNLKKFAEQQSTSPVSYGRAVRVLMGAPP